MARTLICGGFDEGDGLIRRLRAEKLKRSLEYARRP
jgi:hypothetical protein